MSVSSTSSSGAQPLWQTLAQLKAARAGASGTTSQAQSSESDPAAGVSGAASKLATDLSSFVSQLTGGTSQATAATSPTTGTSTTSNSDAAAKLSTDLQSFLTQLQSVGGSQAQGPQGAKPHHHRHHDNQSADTASASSVGPGQSGADALASADGSPPSATQASAEFVHRITRAFESYAAQTSGSANSNSVTSSLGSVSA